MAYDYKKHFGEITLTQDLTTCPRSARGVWRRPSGTPSTHQIVLYLGCNVLRTSHMVRTVTAIFDRLGLDYVAVGGPTCCCGIVHHRNGDTAASGGMNKRTVELFQRYKPERSGDQWCPSCMYFYDEVRNSPGRSRCATRRSSWPTVSRRSSSRIGSTRRSRSTTTRRASRDGARSMRRAACSRPCRGSATSRSSRSRGLDALHRRRQAQLGQSVWDGLIRDEIGRARAGGAEILATVYHGCQRLICGFEAEGRRSRSRHYLSVFARALGIEFEDRLQEFRLWQDPERVLAESTPCQTREPRRVDARGSRGKTFGRIAIAPGAGIGRGFLAAVPASRSETVVEIGLFTEFEWRPGADEAQAFDESLAQVTAAEDLGYDAVWLAELHFQKGVRFCLAARRRRRDRRADEAREDRLRRPGCCRSSIIRCASPRDVATARPPEQGTTRLQGGTKRAPRPLHGLQASRTTRARSDSTRRSKILLKAWTEGPSSPTRASTSSSATSAPCPGRTQKPHPPLASPRRQESYAAVGRRGLPIFPGGADVEHQRARALRRRLSRRVA